ncbi:hypothetical protein ACFQH9_32130 [Pseudonocardia lutea]|jgi:hypothetical protein|uniref:Uncharacterized protein n=1 Tax=Pseudonocardia lutea TaxID=2172015 RepID=A0ABW1IJ17_9PSEU
MREGPESVRPAGAGGSDAERAARLVRRCVDLDRRGAPATARHAALDQARAAVATVPPGRFRERLSTVCDILTDLQRDDTAEAVRAAIVRARAALGQPAGS